PMGRRDEAHHTTAASWAPQDSAGAAADAVPDYITGGGVTSLLQQPCPRCGAVDQPLIGPGKGPHHASALCAHCDAHLRWPSARSPEEQATRRQLAMQQAMAQKLPSPRQLAYLVDLGDDGPPPATMAEASQRIEALRREGGQA